MSVSFNEASTLQAATSHQCSRDADGDGEGGRNGYPSDSVETALIRPFRESRPDGRGSIWLWRNTLLVEWYGRWRCRRDSNNEDCFTVSEYSLGNLKSNLIVDNFEQYRPIDVACAEQCHEEWIHYKVSAFTYFAIISLQTKLVTEWNGKKEILN